MTSTLRRTAVCAALVLAPAAVSAQPLDATRDAEARTRFSTGREAFSRGDYATAVTEFERAYVLSRRPQLLYNVGTTYERLHRWDEARNALQRYLDAVPDAPDRAEVEGRIRIIDVEIQHQAITATAQAEAPRVVVVERPVIVTSPVRPWRVTAWVAGGLTVVSGGLVLAVGLLANQHYSQLLHDCSPNCPQSDVDDMRLRRDLVNTAIGVTAGATAVTITAVLLDRFLDRAPATSPAVRSVALTPGRDGATLAVGGTF